MTSLNTSLSKTLGIEYAPDETLPAKVLESKEIVVEDATPNQNDTVADYDFARSTLRDLIKKGRDAIDDIHDVAKADETARSYEVLGALIKTVAETTTDLYDIHKKTKEIQNMDSNRRRPSDVNIDKAVFCGTTSDLLDRLRNENSG